MATPAATDYINDPRFSQTFELPADPANGRPKPFKIAYADYGYRNETHLEEGHVLLFFGPLLGSRFHHIAKDELAKKQKIRIINPDRPGIGGTDMVDVKERMNIWRVAVPALLASLSISRLSAVASHSGGTIYALDFLLHHPHLLRRHAYLAMGGPWILPTHSAATTATSAGLSLLHHLPTVVSAPLIGSTDKVARLVNSYVGPLVGTCVGVSSGVMAKVTKSAPSSSSSGGALAPAPVPGAAGEGEGAGEGEKEAEVGGVVYWAKYEEKIWSAIVERVFKEGVKGISGDAVVFLQKVEGMKGWGDWGDYDKLIPQLVEGLRAEGVMLSVDVFYAEKDDLIGARESKGPAWFDKCWKEGAGEVVQFQSRTVKGADHDSVWNLKGDVVQEIFEKIGGLGDS